jgi:hypothetical protein
MTLTIIPDLYLMEKDPMSSEKQVDVVDTLMMNLELWW